MEPTVTELVPDVFRISVTVGASGENVSCFLIRDEKPAMIETNLGKVFDIVYPAVAELVDPKSLRYLFIPNAAGDECGALNHFLEIAPDAEPVCSPPGRVTLADFSVRLPRVMMHGQRIELGRTTIMGVQTPWAPTWDSMVFYDETDRLLFCGDLFISSLGEVPVTADDLTENMVAFYQRLGTFPSRAHLEQALQRIEALDIEMLCGMHGPCLTGDPQRYYQAMQDNDVAGLLDAPLYTMNFEFSSDH